MEHHLSGKAEPLDGLWDLIARQRRVFGSTMPGFYLWLLLVFGPLSLWRSEQVPLAVRMLSAAGLSYLVFHVFGVRSLSPLRAAQPANTRYLAALVPFGIVVAAAWLARRSGGSPAPSGATLRLVAPALAALSLYVLTCRYPGAHDHPFAQLDRARALVHDAYRQGRPVLVKADNAYSIHATVVFFWDDFEGAHYRKTRTTPRPQYIKLSSGRRYEYLADPSKLPSRKWHELRRLWKGERAVLARFQGRHFSFTERPFSKL